MDQPVDAPDPRPQPVCNVPADLVCSVPAGPLIVRVGDAGAVSTVAGLPLDRLVWLEVPLHLAEYAWPRGAPLDVVLEEPAREASGLYRLTRVLGDHPVRVTIPSRPGLARAARIAMALHLPVRLVTTQPAPSVLAELDDVLDGYLHDSQTSAPVEFLQAALAWLLHGDAPPLWIALELDPAWYPRVGMPDQANDDGAPAAPGVVSEWLERLVTDGAECADCRFRTWCQGFFKWPDPAYACDGVTRVLARLEDTAAALARDLDQARAIEP